MMSKMNNTIDFYYSFVSPYSYLAFTQIHKLAEKYQATVCSHPLPVSELMEIVGNVPTTLRCKNKFHYTLNDLNRWSDQYGVELKLTPHLGKVDDARLLRGAQAAIEQGQIERYNSAIYKAIWVGRKDVAEKKTLGNALRQEGLNMDTLFEYADSIIAHEYQQSSLASAAEKGIFGTPAIFYKDVQYFGNDRLGFLEKELFEHLYPTVEA